MQPRPGPLPVANNVRALPDGGGDDGRVHARTRPGVRTHGRGAGRLDHGGHQLRLRRAAGRVRRRRRARGGRASGSHQPGGRRLDEPGPAQLRAHRPRRPGRAGRGRHRGGGHRGQRPVPHGWALGHGPGHDAAAEGPPAARRGGRRPPGHPRGCWRRPGHLPRRRLLGHPRPVGPVDAQSAATTAAVNEALRAAVEDSGMDYVDLASAFAASGDVAALISDDGLHPNAEGIRVIGEALAAAHP
ncbi:SGNH/GDSL hydrolase family protein [Propioniciclava sp. MC1683]|nr:SGNH/GDSL hydrolase family protein [Propioniciclava sp. MC1683]